MQKTKIPNTDLEVSNLCFGIISLRTSTKDPDRLIGKFVESGGCFFDTAHCCSF